MSSFIENNSRNCGWLILATACLICTVVALAPAVADAQEGAVVVAAFDAAAQELPEGITISKRGDMYVTMGFPSFWGVGDGQIKKINDDGTETELAYFEDGQGPAGIVVNARGDVYFAWPNPGNPANGVYRLHDDGSVERLPGSEGIVVANGLAFDRFDNLFVSDSILGTIWRMPADGSSPAEAWFTDLSLLDGCGDVGANGVAIWRGNVVYVANTSRGLLVSIPILEDGTAGEGKLIAGDNTNGCAPDDLWGLDGIALDAHGMVYAVSVLQHKLIRINPDDGTYDVLLTVEDGLYNPASIAFGTGKGDRQSVFITNYALFPDIPDFGGVGKSEGPAVLKYDVGVPGLPQP